MLDEIINYVQSLQQEVEFLSMKLASVNPRLEFNMDSLLSKDVFQPNGSFPHQTYPLDSSASAFFGQQTQEFPPVHTDLSNGDHTSTTLCQNNGMQLPPVDEFGQGLPQVFKCWPIPEEFGVVFVFSVFIFRVSVRKTTKSWKYPKIK
ncbi:hypothetical protein CsSME_00000154 [Camellia sinensis var. sinensis]|uniref:transcription factor bHLH62-like n=1 Tax=Camellia sinensis TaxID=4442 RepID=UPI001036DA52|nr:transcription factor bHLH62-like [Camellia sinensis]